MKILETILTFLTGIARIIFPRRKHAKPKVCPSPTPEVCPRPCPLPEPPLPSVPMEGRDGSDPDSPGGDTLALQAGDWGTNRRLSGDWLGMSGYTLMLAGGVGFILKLVL